MHTFPDNFRQSSSTTKIKPMKQFLQRINGVSLYYRVVIATKIKPRENLTDEIFYQQFPDYGIHFQTKSHSLKYLEASCGVSGFSLRNETLHIIKMLCSFREERQRERERQRQREIQRDRDRDRETDRERHRERHTQRERERDKYTGGLPAWPESNSAFPCSPL